MYVAAFDSKNGEKIDETLCIIEPRDRNGLANEKVEKPTWHQWDGQCGNPEVIPIGYNTALLFYGDFYYPDEKGGTIMFSAVCSSIFFKEKLTVRIWTGIVIGIAAIIIIVI